MLSPQVSANAWVSAGRIWGASMTSATGKSMPSKATTTCCALKSLPLSGNPTGSCSQALLIRVINGSSCMPP